MIRWPLMKIPVVVTCVTVLDSMVESVKGAQTIPARSVSRTVFFCAVMPAPASSNSPPPTIVKPLMTM